MTLGPGPRRRLVGLFRWGLAAIAIAFVAWVVPVRDRCWDPRAPASTHVAVSRDAGGCVLHLKSGDVAIDAASCASLRCEPGLVSSVAHARAGWVAAMLALYGLGTVAWAARWRSLLGLAGVDLPLGSVWRISIEAQAGGVVLPGGIGGDALRVAAIAARSDDHHERPALAIAVASVLLDRAIGLSVLMAMAGALAFAWGGGLRAGPLAAVLVCIPVGFVVAVAAVRAGFGARARWLVEGRVGRSLRPALEYVRHPDAPRSMRAAALAGIAVAAAQFAVVRGLVFALGAAPSPGGEKWIYLGAAMAFVVAALPTLPGAWGTSDAAYVFFFGMAGIAPGSALAVCLLYRLFWYVCGVAGALLHLERQLVRPRRVEPAGGAERAPASSTAGPPADPPA